MRAVERYRNEGSGLERAADSMMVGDEVDHMLVVVPPVDVADSDDLSSAFEAAEQDAEHPRPAHPAADVAEPLGQPAATDDQRVDSERGLHAADEWPVLDDPNVADLTQALPVGRLHGVLEQVTDAHGCRSLGCGG